jgi:poly-gamma-glutamate synthesis protein (capsule biosynthesis protein)
VLVALLMLSACSQTGSVTPTGAKPGATSHPATASPTGTSPGATPSATAKDGAPVRISFGGDVHFAGASAAGLSGELGSAVDKLADADISMVNLETAITTRGTAAPKEFTFRAPPAAMGVLRKAGIDVVTIANNHGMDYGRVGLSDTLAAAERYHLPLIGAGADVTAAYRPYLKTVRGVRIAILAATDVLDTFAISTWPATESEPGLASAKDPTRLLDAVRAAGRSADVVVVDLHWGVERQQCPTTQQLRLLDELLTAGADVVVGSHAHVVQPTIKRGRTAVAFGLGNFVFYAHPGLSAESGVFTVTVDRGGVLNTNWTPAQIRAGRPQLLTGGAADAARDRLAALGHSCGVT